MGNLPCMWLHPQMWMKSSRASQIHVHYVLLPARASWSLLLRAPGRSLAQTAQESHPQTPRQGLNPPEGTFQPREETAIELRTSLDLWGSQLPEAVWNLFFSLATLQKGNYFVLFSSHLYSVPSHKIVLILRFTL